MQKYLWTTCVGILLFSVYAYAQGYVRKTIEPDFFIPTKDRFHQQEKLPPIFIKQNPEKTEVQKEITAEPDYKSKYGEYHKNLQKIAKGEVISHPEMVEALLQMQNSATFEVKKTPSQETKVKQRFEKVLKEVL